MTKSLLFGALVLIAFCAAHAEMKPQTETKYGIIAEIHTSPPCPPGSASCSHVMSTEYVLNTAGGSLRLISNDKIFTEIKADVNEDVKVEGTMNTTANTFEVDAITVLSDN